MRPVVFDLDGTLVHSVPDIHAAVNRTLMTERLPPLDLPTVEELAPDAVFDDWGEMPGIVARF